jgi:nucleotide-binding universal stress UspA family protein
MEDNMNGPHPDDIGAIKKILIPTDGSLNAKAAVARGLELARLMGADVTALNVVDLTSFIGYSDAMALPNLLPMLEKDGREAVEYVRQEGERIGVRVNTMVVESGTPAHKIVEISKDHDLIVMGSLGRTGMAHLMLGSVAERVVRHAECPVLVVRTPRKEQPAPG